MKGGISALIVFFLLYPYIKTWVCRSFWHRYFFNEKPYSGLYSYSLTKEVYDIEALYVSAGPEMYSDTRH